MSAYENALFEEGTREDLFRAFLKERDVSVALRARVAKLEAENEKLRADVSALDWRDYIPKPD